jgi:hypothetical protein
VYNAYGTVGLGFLPDNERYLPAFGGSGLRAMAIGHGTVTTFGRTSLNRYMPDHGARGRDLCTVKRSSQIHFLSAEQWSMGVLKIENCSGPDLARHFRVHQCDRFLCLLTFCLAVMLELSDFRIKITCVSQHS